jgi:hypothetical protein
VLLCKADLKLTKKIGGDKLRQKYKIRYTEVSNHVVPRNDNKKTFAEPTNTSNKKQPYIHKDQENKIFNLLLMKILIPC